MSSSTSAQFSQETLQILYELTPAQRNTLLVRYAEILENYQQDIDKLLEKCVVQDYQILLKYKSEVEREGGSVLSIFNKVKDISVHFHNPYE